MYRLIVMMTCFAFLNPPIFSEQLSTSKKSNASVNEPLSDADSTFESFERSLEVYFSDVDKTAKKEISNALGQLLSQNKEDLKKSILNANAIFSDLRLKFRDIVFAYYGNFPDTNSDAIAIDKEIVSWYTTYLKSILGINDQQEAQKKGLNYPE